MDTGAALRGLAKLGLIDQVGEWSDGEPMWRRPADVNKGVLEQLLEQLGADERALLERQFCDNATCGLHLRFGQHYVRVVVTTATAGFDHDNAWPPEWSGIFCNPGCASHGANLALLNNDAINDPFERRS